MKIRWFFYLVLFKYEMKGERKMKIEINVNKDEENERIVIYAKELTKDLQQLIRQIEKMIVQTKLYGKKDDELYPLDLDNIIRFYSEDRHIYAEDEKNKYKVDKRFYELEEMLPGHFMRISQSEIINIHCIKKLKQEFNGFIKISFTNGVSTYSSRRYVKKIKEALNI